MCPREKMKRPVGYMDLALFKRLIDECSQWDSLEEVHLHGFGEPLIDPYLTERVRYAKEKGIRDTYVVTNASLLTSEVSERLICAGLDRIKVSFYGATKEAYEVIHRGLTFEVVKDNVRDLFDVRRRLDRSNPRICLQFLPQSANSHEEGIFKDTWQDIIDLSRGDRLSQAQLHNYATGRVYNPVNKKARRTSCGLPFETMHILWNGDVAPCCYDYNGCLVLGNVVAAGLREVWNNKAFQHLRKVHRNRTFSRVPLCDGCDQLKVPRSIEKRLLSYFALTIPPERDVAVAGGAEKREAALKS